MSKGNDVGQIHDLTSTGEAIEHCKVYGNAVLACGGGNRRDWRLGLASYADRSQYREPSLDREQAAPTIAAGQRLRRAPDGVVDD
jgi:hypothetical protein